MSGSSFSYNLFLDENQQLRYSDNGPGSLISVGPEGAQMSSAPPGLAGDLAVCNGWMVFDTEGCAYLNEPLFLSSPPTLPDHAATKDYVDQAINGGPGGPFLPVTGGTATGPLVIDTTADPHNTAIPLTVRSGDYPEIRLYNLAGGGWPAVKMFGNIGSDCAYIEGNRVLANGSTSTRWALELGTAHPETGGNVGTMFNLRPFSDAGSPLPPILGMTRLGVVTWGGTPQSTLQMTPGAATTNPFTMTATGTGGIVLGGAKVQIGSGTQNTLTITPGAAVTNPVLLAPAGSGAVQVLGASGLIVGAIGTNYLTVTPGSATNQPLVLTASGQPGTGIQINANVGFNSTPPIVRQTVTGAWAGNTAGKALCVALAATGLIIDSTTA